MSWPPNLSPYIMFWGGDWRPVTWLGDRIGDEVDTPDQARCAVLYLGWDEWVAVQLMFPADVVRSEIPAEFSHVNNDPPLTRKWPPILSRDQLTKRRR